MTFESEVLINEDDGEALREALSIREWEAVKRALSHGKWESLRRVLSLTEL